MSDGYLCIARQHVYLLYVVIAYNILLQTTTVYYVIVCYNILLATDSVL